MAGTVTGITVQNLEQVLRQKTEFPLHRVAAAALTVAFQICKTDHLSRGENVTDDMIKDEIKALYYEFIATTDPHTGAQLAAQQARKP